MLSSIRHLCLGLKVACLSLGALAQEAPDKPVVETELIAVNNTINDLSQSSASNSIVYLNPETSVLRIGFINFRHVMSSIPQLRLLQQSLDKEFAEQVQILSNKQQQLLVMEEKLSNMVRGNAYSDYEKQVIAKRREYGRDEADYRDAYSVRRNEQLAQIQRLVVDEIVALAKAERYTLIINETGVIYASEEIDLTTQVIKRLGALIGE